MSARPFRLTRPTIPENAILPDVLKALRWHPAVSWCARFNSGARGLPGGRYIRFNTLDGCPDILGQLKRSHGGVLLAVEAKRVGEHPTDEQRDFLELVRFEGGCAGVARNVGDAIAIVDGFVKGQRGAR